MFGRVTLCSKYITNLRLPFQSKVIKRQFSTVFFRFNIHDTIAYTCYTKTFTYKFSVSFCVNLLKVLTFLYLHYNINGLILGLISPIEIYLNYSVYERGDINIY